MAVQIDDNTPVTELTDDELVYLAQRDRRLAEVTPELIERGIDLGVNHDPVFQVNKAPNFGDANTKQANPPRTRKEGEDDPSYLDAHAVKEANLTKPQLVGIEDDDDDDEDDGFEIPDNQDYDSWTNDQLRALLQRRADEGAYTADLDGKKSVLAQRLRDQDEAENA